MKKLILLILFSVIISGCTLTPQKNNQQNNDQKVNNIIVEEKVVETDTDGDGLKDDLELFYGTNINNIDSDGDSYNDGEEVKNGYNPMGTGKLILDKTKDDAVDSGQAIGEPVFPNGYFLKQSDWPAGFVLHEDSGQLDNFKLLTGFYGEMDINTVKSAYINIYTKPGDITDELGTTIVQYKTIEDLDKEVEKIKVPVEVKKLSNGTYIKVGAIKNVIYLRHKDVLILAWCDSDNNFSLIRSMADSIKKQIVIYGGEEIEVNL